MAIDGTNPANGSALDPSTDIDNPDNWDYADPDDEEGQPEETQEAGTGSEQDELSEEAAQAAAEDEEAESEQSDNDEETTDEDSQEQTDDEDPDAKPATFKLSTGEEISEEQFTQERMMKADYTRKTQEVAESRRTVVAQAQQLQAQIGKLSEFIAANLPPPPDANLAYTDPNAFTAQKAMYDQQVAQVQQLLSIDESPKALVNEINQTDLDAKRADENTKLALRFPQAATDEGLKEFQAEAVKTAKAMGFTDEEANGTLDHRIYTAMHYAGLGLKAEKAKVTAKRKIAAAPDTKSAPVKQRKASTPNNAMQKLRKTGSIHDAVNIDFD